MKLGGDTHGVPVTVWLATGLLNPAQIQEYFGVPAAAPVPIIVLYRELVCCDVEEPDLARAIVALTDPAERREVRLHFMGHDAWAKRGSANTVVEQMEPILLAHGLRAFDRADIDRVGGWRLLYNAWASARRLRKWPASAGPYQPQAADPPALFISAACPDTISAVPMLICDEKNPLDVRKMAGQFFDDVMDALRYGVKSHLNAETADPAEVRAREIWQRYPNTAEGNTNRAMAMLRLQAEQQRSRFIRRRPRA
ncbi:MAG TPA: hypothetical protein VMB85_06960 [Bryobacteraceae bacterium]|nr:hypothetical protein [Bryobacteraceae bacterium]